MSISISSQLLQVLVGKFPSRRLLLHHAPSLPTPTTAVPPNPENTHNSSDPYTQNNSFDASVIMVLSVLLCALIFSLGLHSMIRCALRCSSFVSSESEAHTSAGSPSPGVKRKTLKSFPTVNYSADLNQLPGLDSECVICLSEFKTGDRLRILPKCNHGFHVRCIDKWLSCHSSCPKCRHYLVETCGKTFDCSHHVSSSRPPQVQEIVVTIAPVEPEGLIHGYR
ncbi:Arabidopsis Toxicos en Levadura 78 [Hibiscus trionum]|uniref:RING-type E3 ubiquitin transferase n=1 Tax=Hibiscus trionum TaxID=183268 RepID=A0A9W7MQ52_HIBTR|nr:Arabidopsis Toxicos en Levadura 78 [Hibiscus trionum]